MLSIEKRAFGILPDGTAVEQYCLTASGGLKVSVLTYGATLQAVKFAGKDVILGYDRLEDYINAKDSYQGATRRAAATCTGVSMALTKKSGKRPSSTRETNPACACPWCRRTGRKGIPAA